MSCFNFLCVSLELKYSSKDEDGGMAQQLGALILAEDLGSVPSTHGQVTAVCNSSSWGS